MSVKEKFNKLVSQCQSSTNTTKELYACLEQACKENEEIMVACIDLLSELKNLNENRVSDATTFCQYCRGELIEDKEIAERCHLACKEEMEQFKEHVQNYIEQVFGYELYDRYLTMFTSPMFEKIDNNRHTKLIDYLYRIFMHFDVHIDIYLYIIQKIQDYSPNYTAGDIIGWDLTDDVIDYDFIMHKALTYTPENQNLKEYTMYNECSMVFKDLNGRKHRFDFEVFDSFARLQTYIKVLLEDNLTPIHLMEVYPDRLNDFLYMKYFDIVKFATDYTKDILKNKSISEQKEIAKSMNVPINELLMTSSREVAKNGKMVAEHEIYSVYHIPDETGNDNFDWHALIEGNIQKTLIHKLRSDENQFNYLKNTLGLGRPFIFEYMHVNYQKIWKLIFQPLVNSGAGVVYQMTNILSSFTGFEFIFQGKQDSMVENLPYYYLIEHML